MLLPVLPVAVPLLAAALLAALARLIPARVSEAIALVASLFTLSITTYFVRASADQPVVYWFGNWFPQQGIAPGICFFIEPLGAGLAAVAGALTVAAVAFSARYFDSAANHLHALLLLFLAAMCGFCLTGDVFNMFVFFELMSASAFALCAYKTDDPGSLQGALNFAVTNTVAACFVLTGIGLLYGRTGALNMAQAGRVLASAPADRLVLIAFVFVVCGYLVKSAVVPFHFWLADAHAVAPSPVCILFSGVMVVMGLFALARSYWFLFHPVLHPYVDNQATVLVGMGVATALVGTLMCYLQRNLKRLLAFSTIGHTGLMLTGIGVLNPDGLAGAAVYVVGHAGIKAALFLTAGILLHRFRSVDEMDLHGKGRAETWTAVIYGAAGLALAGVPFSGLAAGEELMHVSADAAGYGWLRWISVMVGAGTSAAVLRAGGRIFGGWGSLHETPSAPKLEERQETKGGHQRTPLTMLIPATLLVAGGFVPGIVPNLTTAARIAAVRFENTSANASMVLERSGAPTARTPAALQPIHSDSTGGLLAVLAALLIAAAHLFAPPLPEAGRVVRRSAKVLHRLHSGYIGDYVTFLMLGMALFGIIWVFWVPRV